MRKFSVEAFMEASGATGPLIFDIRRHGHGENSRVALQLPFALLGRAANADLVLQDRAISKRHIYLQSLFGHVCWVNLGGLADAPLNEDYGMSGWLHERQTLCIGSFETKLVTGVCTPDERLSRIKPLAAGSAALMRLPAVTLEFLSRGSGMLRWRVDRLIVLLGNSPNCKVRITSGQASRFHCSLVATPAGVWLVDLLGRGGVFLNETRVRHALLEDGDVLRIGSNSMRVRYDDAGADAPRRLALPARPAHAPSQAHAPAPTPPPTPPFTSLYLAPPAAGAFQTAPAAEDRQALVLTQSALEAGLGTLLTPLLNHFKAMQQQMFDQQQQTMMQMFQMFSSLHQDQMEAFREEMDRQRRLTEELRGLQMELNKLRAYGSERPGGEKAPPSVPALPYDEVLTYAEVAVPASAPAGGKATAAKSNTAIKGPSAVPEGQNAHTWLCERMAALQQERQSGWKRLLGFLSGKRDDAAF